MIAKSIVAAMVVFLILLAQRRDNGALAAAAATAGTSAASRMRPMSGTRLYGSGGWSLAMCLRPSAFMSCRKRATAARSSGLRRARTARASFSISR